MPPAPSQPTSPRIAELERELGEFNPRDFAVTAFASLVSIPLSKAKFVPRGHQYLPLLVLGAIGGLTDFYLSENRLRPLRQELQALKEEKKQ
jgi:hypothetical protein